MTQWHKYHFRKSSPRCVLLNKSPNDGGAEGRGGGQGGNCEIMKLYFVRNVFPLSGMHSSRHPKLFWTWHSQNLCGDPAKKVLSKKLQKKNIFWGTIHFVYKIFHKTNISYPLISTWTCAFQGLRNISFSENSANVASDP